MEPQRIEASKTTQEQSAIPPKPTKAIQSNSSTTPTSKYVRDFECLFVPINSDVLRERARTGNLRHCQFRGLCWRYFLKCLPTEFNEWLQSCVESRQTYVRLKTKHLSKDKTKSDKGVESINVVQNVSQTVLASSNGAPSSRLDELREEQQYLKAANECDHKNVYKTIERDVIRTFPDMEFFRQTEMQEILSNVLFIFASENSHLSYKQGMHELLAALLYVLHTDYQNCLINHEGGYANSTIASLMDLKFLEHDVFHLFSALMKSIETWYQNDDILTVPSSDSSTSNNGVMGSRSIGRKQVGSVLGVKLKMISENIVKNYDIELFNHLEALQIAPQIYGIRWMRLLFGREFEFLDLLTVWDAIICDYVPMSLTNYIFASMLVTIRDKLVNGDYTECLNNLMRHQFKDVQYVIRLALHLRDPENNTRPRSVHRSGGLQKLQSSRFTPNQNDLSSLTRKLSQHSLSASKFMSNTVDNAVRDTRNLLGPRFNSNTIFANFSGKSLATGSSVLQTSSTAVRQPPTSKNKFLPNINKFVTSMSQNTQEKKSIGHVAAQTSNHSSRYNHNQSVSSRTSGSSHNQPIDGKPRTPSASTNNRQYQDRSGDRLSQAPKTVKEYELREMQAPIAKEFETLNKSPLGVIGSKNALNLSTESYDDLHTIVDYCWRLLSEQIDSLQRCLPNEKGLSCEDEIFVALAQLKKVRDVLKGSLKLEDELESPVGGGSSGGVTSKK